MTRIDLINSLAASGFFRGQWELDDSVYDAVSIAFVRAAWGIWVESLPEELKERREIGGGVSQWFPKWRSENFDCDDIADQFGCFLELCLAVDAVKLGKPRGGLAGGRFDFSLNANPATRHSRCWFCDYDGKIHGYDAGSDTLDAESQAEKETITFGESI